MNDIIAKAIEASREREKARDAGHWTKLHRNNVIRDEARFREALAVAVEAILDAARTPGGLRCACGNCVYCHTLTRIAAILAGEEK